MLLIIPGLVAGPTTGEGKVDVFAVLVEVTWCNAAHDKPIPAHML